MLFIMSRLFCCAIIYIIGAIIISKINTEHKKRNHILLLASSLILIVVLSLTPIENTFITFSSVEDSYRYNRVGKVESVIEGKATDLVVGKNNTIFNQEIIPKSQSGWKLGMPLDTKTVKKVISDGLEIRVYQHSTTEDCYLSVLDVNGIINEILDNIQSSFFKIENSDNILKKPTYTYYSYLGKYRGEYILFVNGNSIPISI